ncbi:MAG: Holliday junction branch migration protein RuvA [Armatimonadetes bacterium]|nr:Holliday junction branch migration protein RuvA [Armatimonadota bacterium]
MFSYLKGILAKKSPFSAVVDCNGVGYEINIPLSTFDKLPEIGKTVEIQIHFTMNESEGIRLFGFWSLEEKEMFRQLLSISKIGPKTAISVLSGISVPDLIRAVQTSDVKLISTVPGIGKKSAERLIIELKDKVGKIAFEDVPIADLEKMDIVREAESALITLGYKLYEIRKVLTKLTKENDFDSSEELLKATIKDLYKKRNK